MFSLIRKKMLRSIIPAKCFENENIFLMFRSSKCAHSNLTQHSPRENVFTAPLQRVVCSKQKRRKSLSRIPHRNATLIFILPSNARLGVSETWSGRKISKISYTRNFLFPPRLRRENDVEHGWERRLAKMRWGKFSLRALISLSVGFCCCLFHIGIRPSVVLYIVHQIEDNTL